ncbi:MAG: hypothetical protein UIH18_05740 [Fibrobacteraceae bacterium]|nr:hypothetical protein [Fibrobacteraceae bacterium]
MPTRTSAVVAALACLSFVETLCARSCQIANKFLVREPCHYDEMRQRFLSLRDVQNAWRGNPLASRSPHCVRDDNLYYVRDDNLYYVRDDNLFVHLPHATCQCDEVKSFFREA